MLFNQEIPDSFLIIALRQNKFNILWDVGNAAMTVYFPKLGSALVSFF